MSQLNLTRRLRCQRSIAKLKGLICKKHMLRFNFQLGCVFCTSTLCALLSGCASTKVSPPPEIDPSVATTPAIGEAQPVSPTPQPLAETSGAAAHGLIDIPAQGKVPLDASSPLSPTALAVVTGTGTLSQRPSVATVESIAPMRATDDKLTSSLKSFGSLQQELAVIVGEIERLRAENANLSSQLKEAVARADAALSALGRKEIEARDERLAREETDQAARILYDQLRAVARAVGTVGLNLEQLTADSPPTARLEMNTGRLRFAAEQAVTHKVKSGDTLQTLAQRYYGDASKWRVIFNANPARLPLDGNLKVGSEIEIPKP